MRSCPPRESQAGRTRFSPCSHTLVQVFRGAASAVKAEALLQESRISGVPSALSKAPVLCSPLEKLAMAPRKNAKGGGGHSSSSSSSGSGSGSGSPSTGSSGSSSSPGARRGQSPLSRARAAGGSRVGAVGLVWLQVRRASPSSALLRCAGRGRAHQAGRWRSGARPEGPPAPPSGLKLPEVIARSSLSFPVEAGRGGPFIFSLQISGRLTLSQSQGK